MSDEKTYRCQHCYADVIATKVADRFVAVTNGNKTKSPSCEYPASIFHKPMPKVEISR